MDINKNIKYMKRFILRLIFLCICFCGSLGVNAAQKWAAYATSYKKGNGEWSKRISCNIPIIIVNDNKGRKLLNIFYSDDNVESFLIQEKRKNKDGSINLICKNIVTNEPAFFLFTVSKGTTYLFMQTVTNFCVSFELIHQE